jgi:tetratricopeptide (TPR) repeat protein
MKYINITIKTCFFIGVFIAPTISFSDEIVSPENNDIQTKVMAQALKLQESSQKSVKTNTSTELEKSKNSVVKVKRKPYLMEGYVPSTYKKTPADKLGPKVEKLFRTSLHLQEAGKDKQAIVALQKLLKLDQAHKSARLILGRLVVINGQYATVESLLTPLLHKKNKDWQPWFWVGTAQLMSGELDLAAYSLDLALQNDGRFQSAVWVQRAVVEQEKNQSANALRYLHVASDLDADNEQVYINLAYAYEASGYSERANEYYQRFLEKPMGTVRNSDLRRTVIKHLASAAVAKP